MVVTAPLNQPLKADDLADFPDDGMRYELIWGELHMSPAPGLPHQVTLMNLVAGFLRYLSTEKRGMVLAAPVDVKFDEENVVQPDLLVVATENRAAVQGTKFIGTPDLLVEILSAQSRSRDFLKKSLLYSTYHVQEYWIVDPSNRRIHVYVLEGDSFVQQESVDGVARSSRFRGLEIDPQGIFELPEQMRD